MVRVTIVKPPNRRRRPAALSGNFSKWQCHREAWPVEISRTENESIKQRQSAAAAKRSNALMPQRGRAKIAGKARRAIVPASKPLPSKPRNIVEEIMKYRRVINIGERRSPHTAHEAYHHHRRIKPKRQIQLTINKKKCTSSYRHGIFA